MAFSPTSFTVTNTTVGPDRGQNLEANLCDDSVGSPTERLDVAAQELYDTHQAKVRDCDDEIGHCLKTIPRTKPAAPAPRPRAKNPSRDAPLLEVQVPLLAMLDVDPTEIHGLGPSSARQLVDAWHYDRALLRRSPSPRSASTRNPGQRCHALVLHGRDAVSAGSVLPRVSTRRR